MSSTPLRTLRTACALALFAALCSLPAAAQNAALGGVNGIVRDNTGAVVAGAPVIVTNSETGAVHKLITDSEGHYAAEFLQPGRYEVVIGGEGSFGKVDRKNIAVTVGAPVTVDAALPAANVSTEVVVTSDAPLLDTEKVEQSQVVDQEIVSNVPVNSRRFESFVLLTPNVVPDGTSGLIAYRGINGTYNQNIVDGANNNQQFFSEARGRSINAPYVFPVDAIREFESSATGYSAELGGAAGGIINAITKSGGNDFHGDAWEYYRTPGLNALDPINKYNGRLGLASGSPTAFALLTQPVKVQHQFGVSVGGHIIKDKLFYHFTYDGYRKVTPIVYLSAYNSATTSVANLVHLCDGGTTNVIDNGIEYPTTIPGVTSAMCAAAVAAIQANLGAFPRSVKQDVFFPRLDYQMGKTHLSAEFLWQNYHQPNGYSTAITVNNGGQSQNGTADFHERILIANAETVLTSNSANAVHFQWARDLETDSTNTGGPNLSLSGLISIGETTALPRPKFPDEHKWQATDVYSYTLGHQNIKAGFDAFFVHEQIANLFGGNSAFTYSSSVVENNFSNFVQDELAVDSTYTFVASNALPTPGISRHYAGFSQTVDQLTGVGADDFWNQNIDFFAEDQWKVTPKLLLSLGLRYDAQLVPGPDLPNTQNPVAFNATSVIQPDLHMIQPRFGFNWNVYPKTVVRGGYGMFYGQISNSSYYTLRRENGVYQKQYSYTASTANAPYVASGINPGLGPTYTGEPLTSPPRTPCVPVAPATVCTNENGQYASYAPQGGIPIYTPPGPAPVNVVTGAPINIPSTINPALGAGITIRGLDPSFTNPLSQSADITVEQEMPFHTTFTIGWVGNRATHLPVYLDANVDPTSLLNNRTLYYTNPSTGVTAPYAQPTYTNKLYASTGTVATGYSALDSWYNSLVVTIHKPMSHGVEILANYTFAKALDDGQTYGSNGTFNGTDAPINPVFYPKGARAGVADEYDRSDIDVRNRFVGTVVLHSKLPIANKVAAYAVNGWSLSGTYTGQTGEPVTATVSGSYTSISGGALGTPGLAITGDAGPYNAAFTSGPSARVPDFIASRNQFKGPGIHNADARVSRTFPFLSKYNFEFSAEAFNVANHRNILSVNTALVAYTPAATAAGSNPCVFGSAAAGGCNGTLGPLAASAAQFMSPATTTGVIYGPRQLQLLGRFIF